MSFSFDRHLSGDAGRAVSLRHALLGGTAAAILWEITTHFGLVLLDDLADPSRVRLADNVHRLAVECRDRSDILLLGAQVIAEYERIGYEPITPSQNDAGGESVVSARFEGERWFYTHAVQLRSVALSQRRFLLRAARAMAAHRAVWPRHRVGAAADHCIPDRKYFIELRDPADGCAPVRTPQ